MEGGLLARSRAAFGRAREAVRSFTKPSSDELSTLNRQALGGVLFEEVQAREDTDRTFASVAAQGSRIFGDATDPMSFRYLSQMAEFEQRTAAKTFQQKRDVIADEARQRLERYRV